MSSPVIETAHLGFAYEREPVLEDVSLRVVPGEFVALVGPNGSGKSTLLRLILGLLTPRVGEARLFGQRPTDRAARRRLGYVPQRPNLAEGLAATVHDIVTAGGLTRAGWYRRPNSRSRVAADAALEAVDLLELRGARVAELSGGQQQRAFIARALVSQPELLVLDEPVAGIDAEAQRSFRRALVETVRERGGTVLLVSHDLAAVADDLDRVVVLKRRVRFDGPPHALADEGVHLGVHARDLPVWLEGIS